MSYAKRIPQKKFHKGALLASAFSTGGSVSISGSLPLPRKAGEDELADVHAQMVLEGTKKYSKRALQEKLDAMGASLSFSPGANRLVFGARVLAGHADELLALIAHILLEPAFAAGELGVLKKREEANLAMEAQDTRLQAGAVVSRLIYAPKHPNYEEETSKHVAELAALTRARLDTFHARMSAERLVCAAVGDLAPARALALMERHFQSLPHAAIKPTKNTPAKAPAAAAAVATIPNKASIDYIAGIAPRITNTHKDYPALMLGLQVLGNRSGFTGRLMSIVREQEGLTYGVYALPVGFSSSVDGYAMAWATFAPELFERGRAAVLREVRRIAKEGATDEEVKRHCILYEARSRVSLGNSGALARAAHDLVADGRPLSELDAFPKRVLKLTAKEVNAALKKYILVNKLAEAAAGPIEKL